MMSLSASVSKQSLDATWAIDTSVIFRAAYVSKGKTPTKVVMAGAKWNLIWKKHYGFIDFWFSIESKVEVNYTLRTTFPSTVEYTTSECHGDYFNKYCLGKDEFQLLNIRLTKFYEAASAGTFAVRIHADFSCSNYSSNHLSIRQLVEDNQELGLRLFNYDSKNFSIFVDEKTIMIHKLIFAIESPVFATMFEGNFQEARENQMKITDFKAEIVQAAVDYCYRQDISSLIKTYEDQIELLKFADKYDFQTLKPKLEKFLSQKLNKENISLYAAAADEYNALELQKACENFICCFLNQKGKYSREQLAKFHLKSLMDIYAQALD